MIYCVFQRYGYYRIGEKAKSVYSRKSNHQVIKEISYIKKNVGYKSKVRIKTFVITKYHRDEDLNAIKDMVNDDATG